MLLFNYCTASGLPYPFRSVDKFKDEQLYHAISTAHSSLITRVRSRRQSSHPASPVLRMNSTSNLNNHFARSFPTASSNQHYYASQLAPSISENSNLCNNSGFDADSVLGHAQRVLVSPTHSAYPHAATGRSRLINPYNSSVPLMQSQLANSGSSEDSGGLSGSMPRSIYSPNSLPTNNSTQIRSPNVFAQQNYMPYNGSSMTTMYSPSCQNAFNPVLHSRFSHNSFNKRSSFPKEASELLLNWLSNNRGNPYPSDSEKDELRKSTGLTMVQINNWFTNARRRVLKRWDESDGRSKCSIAPLKSAKKLDTTQMGNKYIKEK
ncbi:MAG: DNA binding [Marteilia pararefringens]